MIGDNIQRVRIRQKASGLVGLKDFSISEGLKFKDIALPLRAILTGTLSSPSIYNILDCLGKDEVINRINDIL